MCFGLQSILFTLIQKDTLGLGIPFSSIKLALNAGQIIIVMVNALRSYQITTFDIGRRISKAIAGGPLLMPLDTRQRTCPRGTTWAAVLVALCMAMAAFSIWSLTAGATEAYHIMHSSVRGRPSVIVSVA